MKVSDISVYATTQLVTGEITKEQFVENIAKAIFEDFCMSYRLEPIDVMKMLILHCQKIGFPINYVDIIEMAHNEIYRRD